MEPEVAINKIVQTMIMQGIVYEEDRGDARTMVGQAWAAGYDYRGRELTAHNNKTVVKFNRKMKKLDEYKSVAEAARKNKVGVTGLYSAIERGTMTKKGHYWKYADYEGTSGGDVDK